MNTTSLTRPFELKSISAEGIFTGYGSTFGGEPDTYGDIVQPGAFKASLADHAKRGTMPALLWMHQPDQVIGRWSSMREDKHGLVVEGELALKTAKGAEAYELLKMGAIKGLSIGFSHTPNGYEFNKEGHRVIKSVNLWEVSVVTWPANRNANVESVKAALSSPRELERFLREAGLSRAQAKALISGGYSALGSQGDNGEVLRSIADALREARP